MSKVVDMVGQRYGLLTVIKRGENDKHGKAQWWCQCDCGSPLKLINGAALRRGLIVSCGCNKLKKLKEYNETNVVDEVGNTYGYLTVLRRALDDEIIPRDGRAQWVCQCKCGNEVITTGKLLRDGHKMSCGCAVRSKGEIIVGGILDKNKISFSEQYGVCIDGIQYYFDFAIYDKNKVLKYFIEYDGMQHFKYRKNEDGLYGKKTYEKTIFRDGLKNQWCKDNNIPLIRIPYTHLEKLCIEDLLLETSTFII